MDVINNTIKLIVDTYHNCVEQYSAEDANATIRQALIEANNGSDKLNWRDIQAGKCTGLFTIVEKVLQKTVNEGLEGNEYFMNFVEYINIGDGDEAKFITEDTTAFVIDETALGNQGVRRQRLTGSEEVTVKTKFYTVRIYEELSRILAGKVNFTELIAKTAKAFNDKMLECVYKLWESATADQLGGVTYFPAAGTYDEDVLLTLIDHVEAASGGKTATIVGTKKAVRKLKESVIADSAKEALHNMGYYGKFYGTPVVVLPQRHKVGTTNFIYDDNTLTIIAGDVKPIKLVIEGAPIVAQKNAFDNNDLTQEYFACQKWGMAIVLANNSGIGRYKMTA